MQYFTDFEGDVRSTYEPHNISFFLKAKIYVYLEKMKEKRKLDDLSWLRDKWVMLFFQWDK